MGENQFLEKVFVSCLDFKFAILLLFRSI